MGEYEDKLNSLDIEAKDRLAPHKEAYLNGDSDKSEYYVERDQINNDIKRKKTALYKQYAKTSESDHPWYKDMLGK